MTLEYIAERLKYVGRPLSEAQMNALNEKFGNDANFNDPMLSKVLYVEASLGEDNAFILHEDGTIDRVFNVEEKNTLGIMFWEDDQESIVFIAYY